VLCAVDDDENAPVVLRAAARLARRTGARLVLLHVRRDWPTPRNRFGIAPAPDERRVIHDATLADAERRVARLATDAGVEDWTARAGGGDPADEILAAAREEDAFLVVLGSRGRGSLAGALLGSVSADVLARSECPVVVVPAAAGDVGMPADGLRDQVAPAAVICAVDGSADATVAADAAGRLATAMGGRLMLAHVVPEAGRGELARSVGGDVFDRLEQDRRRTGGRLLEETAEAAGVRSRAEFRIISGGTVEALARLARQERAELVVLGGRRRGRLERLREGDSALALVGESPSPVMVVPGTDAGDGARS